MENSNKILSLSQMHDILAIADIIGAAHAEMDTVGTDNDDVRLRYANAIIAYFNLHENKSKHPDYISYAAAFTFVATRLANLFDERALDLIPSGTIGNAAKELMSWNCDISDISTESDYIEFMESAQLNFRNDEKEFTLSWNVPMIDEN